MLTICYEFPLSFAPLIFVSPRFQMTSWSQCNAKIYPRPTATVGGRPLSGSPEGLTPFPWFPGASKVNLVRIPSAASSPRDTALAAVICSALATVLLALLILCTIYCKRQLMEKKPSCESGALAFLRAGDAHPSWRAPAG